MMAMRKALLRVTGAAALLGLSTTSAFAGACGGVPCDLGVSAQPALAADYGPVTVSSHTPYDYFDSVRFQRAPHVSITRIHGLPPTVNLSDAPVGFTKGCHPESTLYCRQSGSTGTVTGGTSYTPIRPAPAPVPVVTRVSPQTPVYHRPVQTQLVQSSRVVAVGGGFDASKFTPRVYGDPYKIVPGIAHVPTSIVDRNPYRAQAVLDAGPGGITPALLGVPVRPYVPPRLPIGYPAPVVSSATAQGQHALNSVTVRQGYSHGYTQGHAYGQFQGHVGGPLIHPRPPVMTRPVTPQHTAPTVCRTQMTAQQRSAGRYTAQGYVPQPMPTGGRYSQSTCGSKVAARGRY